MEKAKHGDIVKIHFTGHIKGGDVFSTTHGAGPATIEIGSGNALSGLEAGIVGMHIGEQKTIEVTPKEGFGPHLSNLVAQVKKELLPKAIVPEVGLTIQTRQDGEEPVDMTVVAIDDDTVTLDANHPLAGRTLVFDVELLGIGA
jgi:peptidylprolyl isomerase